jgi:hypothetical protein
MEPSYTSAPYHLTSSQLNDTRHCPLLSALCDSASLQSSLHKIPRRNHRLTLDQSPRHPFNLLTSLHEQTPRRDLYRNLATRIARPDVQAGVSGLTVDGEKVEVGVEACEYAIFQRLHLYSCHIRDSIRCHTAFCRSVRLKDAMVLSGSVEGDIRIDFAVLGEVGSGRCQQMRAIFISAVAG